MTAPVLYVYGDDDLLAERAVDRFAASLGSDGVPPPERWDLTGQLATAADQTARLEERLATPVMFGGGTLAVVTDPGALVKSNVHRDRVLRAIELMAPGNAVAFVERAKSNARGPGQKRLMEAVKDAGGRDVRAFAPAASSLARWVESEAREHGLRLASGAAGELADRLGARVTEGDVERRHLTRIASTELDKLALRHATDGGAITPDDVRALVAESTPGSVWALTDAVGMRQRARAVVALDRLLDGTPEPVLLAALHKRVRDLLEVGDRFAAGEPPTAVIAATGLHPFVVEKMAEQARHWTTAELTAALSGLVELDAMVKGAPGFLADAAQRRLAFTLWVRDHAGRIDGPG